MNTYERKQIIESIFFAVVFVAASASIIFLAAIIATIFIQGGNIFKEVGLLKFIFGMEWFPTHSKPLFGIFPLIIGSFVVTIVSLVPAILLGVGSAIYISEIAQPKEKEILKPFIEILAGIPSVIFGLFGMAFVVPWVQKLFNIPTGNNALTAGLILGIMVVPIISSISEDALNAVPKALREASYGLGANKLETIMRVVLPAAKSGVIAAVILGFGRSIGETMVVLMVAGNSAIVPKSLLEPVRPMTSAIAAEMGEAAHGTLHFQALFGIGVVLFVLTFITNLITEFYKNKAKK